MSKLNQEELLRWLEQAHRYFTFEPPGKDEQAYQQIKEMIQKPEVTEEWIQEKAIELSNKIHLKDNICNYIKDSFTRSLRKLMEGGIHERK